MTLEQPTKSPVQAYLEGGRVPWSYGYSKFKNQVIRETFADLELMERFRRGLPLPGGYGPRLDERVVEYPWVIARLPSSRGPVLDAGSTFSTPLILDSPQLADRPLVIYTLATDWIGPRPRVWYVFGDLRAVSAKDASFGSIVCISTLEHVGMAQSFDYSMERPCPTAEPDADLAALDEFRRVLVSGGQLLLTVPFGRREDHGWLRQYDTDGIRRLVRAFGGTLVAETYYRYQPDGWQLATAEECADCRYFNIHATPAIEADGAAAARAVCCLELVRA